LVQDAAKVSNKKKKAKGLDNLENDENGAKSATQDAGEEFREGAWKKLAEAWPEFCIDSDEDEEGWQ
jgi:hypothetical protein